MKVSRVMSTPVISADPGTTIRKAAELMQTCNIGALPILENGRPIGIVTDRDLVIRIIAQRSDIDEARLSEAMSPDPLSCFSDQDIAEAAAMMGDAQVRRLLVMDREDILVGILSVADIAENVSEDLAGEALGEISEGR